MDLTFVNEIVLILGISVGVMFVCHRIGLPPLVGFLVAGILCGPSGFKLVESVHQVEMMAEIGVVLLLFSIGMELSGSELMRLKRPVFLGGTVQMGLAIIVFAGISLAMGVKPGPAVFAGFLAALSSTAIVLKEFQNRAELDSPHGRISLSILIFQDLAIVPLMLFTPFLDGQGGDFTQALGNMALKGAGVVVVVLVLAKYVVPRLFLGVARMRSRELFLMATIVVCLAVALLTAKVGLSLSLGAFLAGLMVSESGYALNALEGIRPFKDIFTSIFFVSVGMLVDVNFVATHPGTVVFWAAALIILKVLTVGLAVLALGYSRRTALMVGLSLGQAGEFSFVLAKVGLGVNLLSHDAYQVFLDSSVITMAVTPWLMQCAPRLAQKLFGSASPRRNDQSGQETLRDHLIIVGFGPGGRQIAHAARRAGIPYLVLEMNVDTVREEKKVGEPIRFGDAAYPAVLEHAGVKEARVLVLTMSDPTAARRMITTARRLNLHLHIIVRTHFVSDAPELLELGASEVVPEEFETSIEIFTRVLVHYLVPNQTIERFITEARGKNYQMLRTPDISQDGQKLVAAQLSGMDLAVFEVEEKSPVAGKSLKETAMRRRHNLTVVAVERAGETRLNPDGEFTLQSGDKAYVFGHQSDVADKAELFSAS